MSTFFAFKYSADPTQPHPPGPSFWQAFLLLILIICCLMNYSNKLLPHLISPTFDMSIIYWFWCEIAAFWGRVRRKMYRRENQLILDFLQDTSLDVRSWAGASPQAVGAGWGDTDHMSTVPQLPYPYLSDADLQRWQVRSLSRCFIVDLLQGLQSWS